MAAVIGEHTLESVGYTGTVDAVQWAALSVVAGTVSSYAVGNSAGAFGATVGGSGARALTIGNGSGESQAVGRGVYDRMVGSVNINLDSVPTGSRWDLICLHRDWDTGTTTLKVINGGSAKQIPPRSQWGLDAQVDDQPLWLARVQAGSSTVAELVDLRVWHQDGIAVARDPLVMSYMNRVGTMLDIGGTLYRRVYGPSGSATWLDDQPPAQRLWGATVPSQDFRALQTSYAGLLTISLPATAPTGLWQLQAHVAVEATEPAVPGVVANIRVRALASGGNGSRTKEIPANAVYGFATTAVVCMPFVRAAPAAQALDLQAYRLASQPGVRGGGRVRWAYTSLEAVYVGPLR